MDPRQELDELRRLDELKRKAGAQPVAVSAPDKSFLRSAFDKASYYANVIPADLLMGGRQVLDATAQMAARGANTMLPGPTTAGMVRDVEGANQAAWNAYQYDYAPEQRGSSGLVRGLGQGAVTAPVTPALRATTLPGAAGMGAGVGGATGALTPIYGAGDNADFWTQKAKQAAIGAASGAATGGVLHGAGRVLAPEVNPQAKQLLNEGVTPTPGQVLGGVYKATEEKARSVPLLGDAITAGQRRAIEEYNRSLYRKALEPIGQGATAKTLPVGNEGIRQVGERLSTAYEQTLAKSVPNPIDGTFKQALASLEQKLPQSIRGDFSSIIDAEIRAKATAAQTLTPSVAKEIESELGRLSAGYSGSSVQAERTLGRALAQAKEEVRSLVQRHNPQVAAELRAIDKGWANLTQLENAGAMLGAKEGIFTPAQFLNAVKKSDKSLRDRAFAGGTARNQELAQAADAVLSSKYPDSGTAGRAMIGALGAGGLGYLNPAIPLVGAAATLPYTPIGQRFAAAALTQRPQLATDAGDILKRLAPWLAVGGAGLLNAP